MRAASLPGRGARSALRARPAALAVGLIAALLLTACEEAQVEFIAELATEWAIERKIMTTTCTSPADTDCTYDLDTAALGVFIMAQEARQAASAWMGGGLDPEEQVTLDSVRVVRDQEVADRLVRDGAAQGGAAGLDMIDRAIDRRPNDWSYWDNRAAILLEQGSVESAQESFATSEQLVEQAIRGGGDCVMLRRNMLNNRLAALDAQLARNRTNATLYAEYEAAQGELGQLEAGGPGSPCP